MRIGAQIGPLFSIAVRKHSGGETYLTLHDGMRKVDVKMEKTSGDNYLKFYVRDLNLSGEWEVEVRDEPTRASKSQPD
jgi:hypothetical protein